MWDGALNPSFIKKKFTDHFEIVSTTRDEILSLVDVTVEFDKSPGKQYVFTIPAERYRPDKEVIGREIKRQLGE
jgi:hypothetical protein